MRAMADRITVIAPRRVATVCLQAAILSIPSARSTIEGLECSWPCLWNAIRPGALRCSIWSVLRLKERLVKLFMDHSARQHVAAVGSSAQVLAFPSLDEQGLMLCELPS